MKVKRNKHKEKIVKFLNNLEIKLGKNSFVNESLWVSIAYLWEWHMLCPGQR